VVVIMISMFWDITLCSLVKVNRRFGGTYRSQLQLCCLLHVCSMLDLPFDPEDGADIFLRSLHCYTQEDRTLIYG
jgi:hypothetical protein